jgi:predicted ATPase with chaperone activity
MRVVATSSLGSLLAWLRGQAGPRARALTHGMTGPAGTAGTAGVQVLEGGSLPPSCPQDGAPPEPGRGRDLADVVGQPTARRAAEICAAGGHQLLLLGPPAWATPRLPHLGPAASGSPGHRPLQKVSTHMGRQPGLAPIDYALLAESEFRLLNDA